MADVTEWKSIKRVKDKDSIAAQAMLGGGTIADVTPDTASDCSAVIGSYTPTCVVRQLSRNLRLGQCIILALLLCLSRLAAAEMISGVLLDDGVPVANAKVALIDAGSSVIINTVHADKEGRFEFTVNPGEYNLRASANTYADAWLRGVALSGNDVTVTLSMTPAVFEDSDYVPSSDDCDE